MDIMEYRYWYFYFLKYDYYYNYKILEKILEVYI